MRVRVVIGALHCSPACKVEKILEISPPCEKLHSPGKFNFPFQQRKKYIPLSRSRFIDCLQNGNIFKF